MRRRHSFVELILSVNLFFTPVKIHQTDSLGEMFYILRNDLMRYDSVDVKLQMIIIIMPRAVTREEMIHSYCIDLKNLHFFGGKKKHDSFSRIDLFSVRLHNIPLYFIYAISLAQILFIRQSGVPRLYVSKSISI